VGRERRWHKPVEVCWQERRTLRCRHVFVRNSLEDGVRNNEGWEGCAREVGEKQRRWGVWGQLLLHRQLLREIKSAQEQPGAKERLWGAPGMKRYFRWNPRGGTVGCWGDVGMWCCEGSRAGRIWSKQLRMRSHGV